MPSMSYQPAELELEPPVTIQQGAVMRFYHNPDAPLNDPENPLYWSIATYDPQSDDDPVFQVPEHWHKHHDESWTVYEGRMKVRLDGREIVVNAGDPSIRFKRLSVHGVSAFKGEKLVVRETPLPSGQFKEEFFRDLYQKQDTPDLILAFRVMSEHDMYPSTGWSFFDQLLMFVMGPISKLIAPPNPWKRKTE